jgi:hypothetical protein
MPADFVLIQLSPHNFPRREEMIEATQNAANVLRQMLAQVETPESHCLRLTYGKDGPAIVPDAVRSDDITIVQDDDDQPVMVVDPPVADRLDGRTLDFNPTSSQLVVS